VSGPGPKHQQGSARRVAKEAAKLIASEPEAFDRLVAAEIANG
jgi:hypothetical protein